MSRAPQSDPARQLAAFRAVFDRLLAPPKGEEENDAARSPAKDATDGAVAEVSPNGQHPSTA